MLSSEVKCDSECTGVTPELSEDGHSALYILARGFKTKSAYSVPTE